VAIVLAAGSGSRIGGATPKTFANLGGRTMLAMSVDAASACAHVDELIVAVPAGWEGRARDLLRSSKPVSIVTGGPSRQQSVLLALQAVAGREVVVCHDAARPFASARLFSAVIDALFGDVAGAVPVVPVHDTVKRVRSGRVVATEPRDELGLAQTPQAFHAAPLLEAHRAAAARGRVFTDDAALMEWAGHHVVVVEGERENFKVTTMEDMARAELILGAARQPTESREAETP